MPDVDPSFARIRIIFEDHSLLSFVVLISKILVHLPSPISSVSSMLPVNTKGWYSFSFFWFSFRICFVVQSGAGFPCFCCTWLHFGFTLASLGFTWLLAFGLGFWLLALASLGPWLFVFWLLAFGVGFTWLLAFWLHLAFWLFGFTWLLALASLGSWLFGFIWLFGFLASPGFWLWLHPAFGFWLLALASIGSWLFGFTWLHLAFWLHLASFGFTWLLALASPGFWLLALASLGP